MVRCYTVIMQSRPDDKLVAAISSRALFDLENSHRVFVEQGVDAYCRYQIEHEDEVLAPGVAFGLAKKLLALNDPGSVTSGWRWC